jgi:hypothetical protein
VRLSKAQLRVVEALQNGGHVWLAAGSPYLIKVDPEGRKHSDLLNKKTFNHLKEMKIIVEGTDFRWRLK